MKYVFLALVVFIVTACEKEKIVTVYQEKKNSWVSHPAFIDYDKYKFNAFTNGSLLLLYGPNSFSKLTKDKEASHYLTLGYPSNYTFGSKLPIGKEYYPEIISNSKSIYLHYYNKRTMTEQSNISVDFISLDSNFNGLNKNLFKSTLSINNRNQLLIPYFSTSLELKVYFFLLDIEIVNPGDDGFLRIKNNKLVSIGMNRGIGGEIINFITNVDDYFIVSNIYHTYKINSVGEVSVIANHGIREVFTSKNVTYGLNRDGQVTYSLDNGNSWQEASGTPDVLAIGSFYPMGDSLVFALRSQVFSARFTPSSYSLRELKNDGLDGNFITSITEFNDSIYATTYSGVYYKSKKDFFETKPEK